MRTLLIISLLLHAGVAAADDAATPTAATAPAGPLADHSPAPLDQLLDTGRSPVEQKRKRRTRTAWLNRALGDAQTPPAIKADLHLELGHLSRDAARFGSPRHRPEAEEAAIDQFSLAIHAEPSSSAAVEARMARALLYRDLGRTDAMLDDLGLVLSHAHAGPWSAVAHLMLGEHFISVGDLAAAHRMLSLAGTVEGPVDAYASWLDAVVQRSLGFHHSATLSAMRAATLATRRSWRPSRNVSQLARSEAVRNAAYLDNFDDALQVIDVVCMDQGMGCLSRLRWQLADHYEELGRDGDAATASGLAR